MGILTKEVKTKWNNINKEHLISKGYIYTGYRDDIVVKVEDLKQNSQCKIDCECDWCGKQIPSQYCCYNEIMDKFGNYLCFSCRSRERYIRNNNVLYHTHPEIAKRLKNKEDGFKYSYGTSKKLEFECEYCNTPYKAKPIKLAKAKSNLCPNCGDGFSFNNKFINNVLEQTGVVFEREYYNSDWTYIFIGNQKKKVRYDFVVYIQNKKYIIEADGGWHYIDNGLSGQSKEESKEIDSLKDDLATKNGFIIIRIDCFNNYEEIDEYIKKQLLEKIGDIIDFSNVDWDLCYKNALSSEYYNVWKLINDGYTRKEILDKMKYSVTFLDGAINKGIKLGTIEYQKLNEKYEDKKQQVKKLWNEGVFDLNKIVELTDVNETISVRKYLNTLYEDTGDLFYKIEHHKYYLCIEENTYYSIDALYEKFKKEIKSTQYDVKTIKARMARTIWRSINRQGTAYKYTWKIATRQEAYFDNRKNNTTIIESET